MERLRKHISSRKWLSKSACAVLMVFCCLGQASGEINADTRHDAFRAMSAGDYRRALELLLMINDKAPTDEDVKKEIARCYTEMGREKLERGELTGAISDFDSALYYNDDGNIRFLKGYALYRARELDRAVYELEKARDRGGSNPNFYALIGRTYYDMGELITAISYWRIGAELFPDNQEIKDLIAKGEREARTEEKFRRGKGAHFTIFFDAERDDELSASVLQILEDAYLDVGVDLGHHPAGAVSVIIYTKREFRDAVSAPDWAGGVYDGKIRIPVGGLKGVSDELKGVIYHEYTHVAVRSMTRGKAVPEWLNEGLAEYEASRHIIRNDAHLKSAAAKRSLIPLARLESGFSSLSGKDSVLAYLQSYSLVKYIIDRVGIQLIREILEDINNGGMEPVLKIMRQAGVDFPALLADWELSIRHKP